MSYSIIVWPLDFKVLLHINGLNVCAEYGLAILIVEWKLQFLRIFLLALEIHGPCLILLLSGFLLFQTKWMGNLSRLLIALEIGKAIDTISISCL
jgi:hypothetical protein